MRRPLTLLLLSAVVTSGCKPGGDDDGDTDTGDADTSDPVVDTDEGDTGDTCSGTLRLGFDDMPDLIEQAGTTWTSQGVTFRAEDYNGQGTRLIRDTDDCMTVEPGAVQARLYDIDCAATEARFRLQSQCGPNGRGCTDIIVGAPQLGALSQATVSTDQEVTATLTRADGFSLAAFGSLKGRLCWIEFDLAPLPEDLAPEDTGAPF